MLVIFFLLFAFCAQQSAAVHPVVNLGYTTYRGQDLDNGVSLWAGMRYSRSTSRVDGMRFAAPADPLPVKGIINATEFGPTCISTASTLKHEFGGKQSEDCLFANVYAPSNATTKSKLPVYVFIQGGGFNSNSNANLNGTKLIKAADWQIVVVNFNYRVGPYGFLAGKEIVENKATSLNNGLKDQRQLLKWVKAHIDQFGGDPDHVTLGGASAGAGSVMLQLTAFGGRDDKLFHAAAIESPATPPLRSVNGSQWQYDALLAKTGCKDLDCMRSMDTVAFQAAVRSIDMPFPGGKNPPLYFWNPTFDHDFIQNYTYNEIDNLHFVKVPTILGDATNEGWIFTPDSVTSQQRAYSFVQDQFPNLNKSNYTAVASVWKGPTNQIQDSRWRTVAADIYGHIRYQCPCIYFSSAFAYDSSYPTWQYRYNVGSAFHVAELSPIWNNGTSAASVFVEAYWASFIRSYDPNKHVAEYISSSVDMKSPNWTTFGKGNGMRMLFDDKNVVQMEDVPDQEWGRCDVLWDMALQLEQVQSMGHRVTRFGWTRVLTYCVMMLGLVQWIYPP